MTAPTLTKQAITMEFSYDTQKKARDSLWPTPISGNTSFLFLFRFETRALVKRKIILNENKMKNKKITKKLQQYASRKHRNYSENITNSLFQRKNKKSLPEKANCIYFSNTSNVSYNSLLNLIIWNPQHAQLLHSKSRFMEASISKLSSFITGTKSRFSCSCFSRT